MSGPTATAFFTYRFRLNAARNGYVDFAADAASPGSFEVFNDGNGGVLQGAGDPVTVNGQAAVYQGYFTGPNAFNPIQPYRDFNIVLEVGGEFFVYSNSNVTTGSPPLLPLGNGTAFINSSGGTLCLLAGAWVSTPSGAVPIESLEIGDLVLTPDGPKAVKFLGLTTRPVFQLMATGKMPIRIEAGALGDLGPKDPLHCTPSHAFAIKGCLVEAQALINGTTIQQLDRWDEDFITYYSIELESHNLIWANELLSETYFANVRDKGFTRDAWNNYADYVSLYGEGEATSELVMPRIPFARLLPPDIRVVVDLPATTQEELLPLGV